MRIDFVKQRDRECLLNCRFDFIICATGYEGRASHITSLLSGLQLRSSKRLCFRFKDRAVHSRKKNDAFFDNLKFKYISVASDDLMYYSKIYHKIFSSFRRTEMKILIDYSCMTSILYASLIKYFIDFANDFDQVNITFAYTPAKYTNPVKRKPLSFNQPIPLFNPIQSTDRKIALIIGLGYEMDKALGLYEYFQNNNEDIYLFLTGQSGSEPFYKDVIKNNKTLMDLINPANVITYDLDNNSHLLSTLDSLVNYLITVNYRVVLAPIGPKVFTLATLLINLIHQEVTTYRLSDGSTSKPIDKFPDPQKELIVTELNLTAKNEEPELLYNLKRG